MSPRYAVSERPAKLQEALHNIGSWLLGAVKAEDGWNELVLDIKPLSGTVFVRITESRVEKDYVGSTGPLKPDSKILPEIEKLQHASYDEREGTWFSSTVVIVAKNWPEPEYEVGAAYNRQEEPQDWEGEGRLTASELRAHFEEFPRVPEMVPDWATERLGGRRDQATTTEHEVEFEVPNPYLTTALGEFAGARTDLGVVNVVRTLLGGDVLLDISDSDFSPAGSRSLGPQSVVRFQVLRLANGMRALCAFSSSEFAKASHQRKGAGGDPVLLRESGIKMLMDFAEDDSCELLVIDPGSPQECFIEKEQARWVLSVPRNDGAKNALMTGDMPRLMAALASPSSFLAVGVRGFDSFAPIFVPATDDAEPDTILFFTSAAEVASLDPSLTVKTMPSYEALKLAETLGAEYVRVNALNPSATLPIGQVKELISLIENGAVAA